MHTIHLKLHLCNYLRVVIYYRLYIVMQTDCPIQTLLSVSQFNVFPYLTHINNSNICNSLPSCQKHCYSSSQLLINVSNNYMIYVILFANMSNLGFMSSEESEYSDLFRVSNNSEYSGLLFYFFQFYLCSIFTFPLRIVKSVLLSLTDHNSSSHSSG